jgi:phosphohistidine phosphatase
MTERRLILMRHASAGPGSGSDRLRHLTERGQAEARRVGERLRELALIPDRVLCSPATRCRETWEAASKAFDAPVAVDLEEPLYNAPAQSLLEAVASVDDVDTLLVLAHNPGISLLAFELGSGSEADASRVRAGFTPATTACFEVDGAWSLVSRRTVRLLSFEGPAEE